MLIVGELINCTRKRVAAAVEARDREFILDLARRQDEAGADYLDVNGGILGQEIEALRWIIEAVQEVSQKPLCVDSSISEVILAALPKVAKRPLINSLSAEPRRLEALLPAALEHQAKVIALCLDENGIPKTADGKLQIARRLLRRLTDAGLALDDIYVDPCLFPVASDQQSGREVLRAIEIIMTEFRGVHTILGLSNVSFGLPLRRVLNRTFLALAMGRGLDAAILDPLDRATMATLVTARTLLGNDASCMKYVTAYRAGRLQLEAGG